MNSNLPVLMELRGIEPLSENPSITASPITVLCFDIPSIKRPQTGL